QFAAYDLAGRGERQFLDKSDLTRRLVPGEALTDKGTDLIGKGRTGYRPRLRHDKRPDDLAAHRVGTADHRRHQHRAVLHQAILDVGRTDAVPAARDQVVLAPL